MTKRGNLLGQPFNSGSQKSVIHFKFSDEQRQTPEIKTLVLSTLRVLPGTNAAPRRRTDKLGIFRQKGPPGPTLEGRKGRNPPQLYRDRCPLLRDPVPNRPVVPCRKKQRRARRPCGMGMHTPHPPQHGSLILRQPTPPEAPCMDPELLPVEVPHLQHPMLRKKRVRMVGPPVASYQPRKALLVPEQ